MLPHSRIATVLGQCLLIAALLLAGACESLPGPFRKQPRSPTKLPPAQIQSELMAFTDSYTALTSQAIDTISTAVPEQRALLLSTKIRFVENAIIIAAGPNPVGALLDMTVMVTMQRQVAQEYWVPEVFGELGRPLEQSLLILEREIWALARRALPEEAVGALEELIPDIRARFPGQVQVAAIRASDFTDDRQATVVQLEGGGSLLQLFQLDPLANLSPAAQEIAQTRLLAERGFFWVKRMPMIIDWSIEDTMMEVLSQAEVQSLVASADRLSEASRALGESASELSVWLPEERAEAIDQVAQQLSDQIDAAMVQMSERLGLERDATIRQLDEMIETQRTAAIDQTFDSLAREREAILSTFENEEVRLRGLLADVKQTMEVATTLSTALNAAVVATQDMVTSFQRDPTQPRPPPNPDQRPFDIRDYEATAEAATATARELSQVLRSLEELMSSPSWDDRSTQIQAAAAEGTATVEQLIDRLFLRGLILVIVFVVGLFAALVLARLITKRPA